jgi:hypothetical protein
VNTRPEIPPRDNRGSWRCVAHVATKRIDSSRIQCYWFYKMYDIQNLVSHPFLPSLDFFHNKNFKINYNVGPSEFLCREFNRNSRTMLYLCKYQHISNQGTFQPCRSIIFQMSSPVHDQTKIRTYTYALHLHAIYTYVPYNCKQNKKTGIIELASLHGESLTASNPFD